MAFRDNYTNFWFNDISSETMKVWVTNNRDLQFQLTPSFTDTFVAPVAGLSRYHTATTFTSSDISVKCIAIGITMGEWKAIENWLAPDNKGRLHFDFNELSYYEAKVKQQIKGTLFIEGNCDNIVGDIYNIEFTVEFTTVGDYAALGQETVVPSNTEDFVGAINNRHFMPMTCSRSKDREVPEYEGIKPSKTEGRLYLTRPTLISNKTVYIDKEYWKKILDKGLDYRYYIIDGAAKTTEGSTTNNLIATVRKSRWNIDGSESVSGYALDFADGSNYSIDGNRVYLFAQIDTDADEGFTFYGTPFIFCAEKDKGASECPFYIKYDEDCNNVNAVMNAGAYNSYLKLSINSGDSNKIIKVYKNDDLLYNYQMSIVDANLYIDGKTGFATYGGTFAEAAMLPLSGGGRQKIVETSVNNGLLEIESGRPELMKVGIFAVVDSSIPPAETAIDEDTNNITLGCKTIYFQPIGDFKYERNGLLSAALFTDIEGGQKYNTLTYPIARNSGNTSTLAFSLENFIFSTDALLIKTDVAIGGSSDPVSMWALTIPSSDYQVELNKVANSLGGVTLKTTPIYAYLSLCDYSEISFSGSEADSYLMMQTRDAF